MQIHDLTTDQVRMLDALWSFESPEQLERFKRSLPLFLRQQVNSLIELVNLQLVDDMVTQTGQAGCPEALATIMKISKKH